LSNFDLVIGLGLLAIKSATSQPTFSLPKRDLIELGCL
jgi:hypothetical protein